MTSHVPTYGEGLPDQVDGISSFFNVHLELVGDVREIHRELVIIEKQYAAQLLTLHKKAAEKKARMESTMVVGSEPSKGWNQAILNDSTLYQAYTQLVTSLAQISQDHVAKADAVNTQVVEALKTLEKHNDDLKKKEMQFFQKLISDRDRSASDRLKSKQKYDDEAQEADAVRQKQVKAGDDKHAERVQRQVEQQQNEMLNAKNSYLISIAIANQTKDKFYREDLPALEDRLQTLQHRMLLRLSGIVRHSQTLHTQHAGTLQTRFYGVNSAFEKLNPLTDQAIYIDHNIRPFTPPPDVVFEPCHNHYDTAEMSVEPAPKVYLQNRLSKARAKLGELVPVMNAKRREMDQYSGLFTAYENDQSLGKTEDIANQFIDASHQAVFYGTSHRILTTEVDTVVAAIGNDEGSQKPHAFKSSSFSIPTQCSYCKSSIWGLSKQGKTCKLCGLSVHTKCELKVPADCGQSSPKRASTTASRTQPPSTSSIIHTKPSASSPPSASSFVSETTSTDTEEYPIATMVYDFTATSDFEISLKEGTLVRVLEADDGSGWVKVLDSSNNDGLVPSSYLEYQEAGESNTEPSGPKVRAIYDYQAQGLDEISLQINQVLELTTGPNGGQNYGDGWWEGFTTDGKTGIFPSNYVSLLSHQMFDW
ncbi:hypothetical protein DL96DRAFT_1712206 [Flagelloscypha sp. PMI_526]|nr:hypothetical protein DL96DRAFT_1712206 [Flagelloscypha sp. PMI_526]